MRDSRQEMYAIISSGLIAGAVTAFLTQRAIFAPEEYVETAIVVKVFLASMNAFLLAGLTLNYARIYRGLPTPTSRMLLVFSSALLFYAVSANPIVPLIFGYEFIPLGPFTYIPDLFVAAASFSMLYESYR